MMSTYQKCLNYRRSLLLPPRCNFDRQSYLQNTPFKCRGRSSTAAIFEHSIFQDASRRLLNLSRSILQDTSICKQYPLTLPFSQPQVHCQMIVASSSMHSYSASTAARQAQYCSQSLTPTFCYRPNDHQKVDVT